MQKLVDTLRAVGKPIEVFESPDGSEVLMLPYGARVIGLYAPETAKNFLWTNSDLKDVDAAKALFASGGWRNTGGDRTWLAPELDIFFPKYPDTSAHFAPIQLDAEDYDVHRSASSLGLSKRMTIALARPGASVDLTLTKSVSAAPDPLRYRRDSVDTSRLAYAGYTLRTSLELHSDAVGQVGLWNLLQLPHGGDILLPTYARTEPLVLFGDIPPEDLAADDHLLRFRIRAAGEHKISVRAAATTGRAGYLYQKGDDWNLVIRNSFVNPSGEYVDCPKTDPDDLGYSFQAVNVDSSLGRFCEMEYHVPAIGKGTGQSRCDDVSQVWAYRGSQSDIVAVARKLVSAAV